MADPSNSSAQAKRAEAGRNLEQVCTEILNQTLSRQEIVVLKGTKKAIEKYFGDESIAQQIVDFNKLPVKRPCDQKQLEDYPDTDLFVLLKKPNAVPYVLGVVSCKVSFHARHTEAAFWGLAVRISSHIPYVCVTEDANIYSGSPSELGSSCNESSAARRLLESFTDGIYIIKKYESAKSVAVADDLRRFSTMNCGKKNSTKNPVFDNPVLKNHTKYCQAVRPFDDLICDILRWRDEHRQSDE